MKRKAPSLLRRKAIHTLLLVTTSTILLSSCVGQSNNGSENISETERGTSSEGNLSSTNPGGPNEPIASSLTSATPEGSELKFDIFSLERHSPDVLVLNMGIANKGSEQARAFQTLSEVEGKSTTPDGVALIDTINSKRYMPLKLTDGETCHCSNWDGQQNIAPGDRIDIWAAFPAPPEDVEYMTVTTPVTPDFIDIPITNASSPDPSIAEAPTSEPRILDIRSFQDDLDSGTSRSNSGNETTVILSSDILFDTNESKLTPTADDSLKSLAKEIDDSSTTTVEIDGYTDSTGNDSINIPLSEARAESVRQRLQNLVTRDGLAFESTGHGAESPVGDNDTEEGRQKNRRVTVTFKK